MQPQSDNQAKLAQGAFINFLSLFLKAFRALFYVFLARAFHPDHFGFYILCFSAIDPLSKVFGFEWGVLRATVQMIENNQYDHIRSKVLRILGISLILNTLFAGLIVYLAPFIAENIFSQPALTLPLQLMAPCIPLLSSIAIFNFSFLAKKDMKRFAFIQSFVDPFTIFIGSIAVYFFLRDIKGIVLTQIFSSASTLLVCLYIFLKTFPKKASNEKTTPIIWKEFLSYCSSLGVMEFINVLKNRIDILFVSRYMSPFHVGVYAAVVEIANAIKKTRQLFEHIFLPVVSSLFESKNFTELKHQYQTVTRWTLILAIPTFICIFINADFFLNIFKPEFVAGTSALQILAIGTLLYIVLGMSEQLLSMTNNPFTNLNASIVLLIIHVTLLTMLIPRYGLFGAGLSTSITLVVVSLLRFGLIYKKMQMTPLHKTQWKSLFAGMVMASLLFITQGFFDHLIWVIFMILVGLLAYFAFYGKFLRFEPEDKQILSFLRLHKLLGRSKDVSN